MKSSDRRECTTITINPTTFAGAKVDAGTIIIVAGAASDE
jgi:hypothetical protein